MAFYFGPAQISVDPEAATGGVIQAAAAAMMLPGTRVAKNGRVYLYVQAVSDATLPGAGGLLYVDAQTTWGAGTNYVVTNGADAALVSSNFLFCAGVMHVLLTVADFGFIQVRGDDFVKVLSTTGGLATLAVANLSNATNPERAIPATTTNIIATNQVGIWTGTVASNAAHMAIDIQGV